jgi:hypothetical protein
MNREGYEGFKQEIIANVGEPVYAARWKFRYLVPDEEDATMSKLDAIDPLPTPLNDGSEAAV